MFAGAACAAGAEAAAGAGAEALGTEGTDAAGAERFAGAAGFGAADVDDPASFLHVLGRGLRGDEHGTDVDGHGAVEVFQRELIERGQGQHTGT